MTVEKIKAQNLHKIPEEEQLQIIKAWFNKYFHCPSESCFIDDDTGNWVFSSGPWDQCEILENYFGKYVSKNIIEIASEQLGVHCGEWNSDLEPHEMDMFLLPLELPRHNMKTAAEKLQTIKKTNKASWENLEPEDVF